MNTSDIVDRLMQGTLTRRRMSRALAQAGWVMATIPVIARPANAAGEITYFAWAGYDTPDIMSAYVEKYGGPPSYAVFADEEEALQKMRSGFRPDVSHICSYLVGRYRDSGLFQPIDTSRLAHYPDLWPALIDIPITKAEGATWFVPFEWGPSSVVFRPDLAPEYAGKENHSWMILFDEKYAGRLGTYDAIDGAVIVAALVAGVADPFNPTDEDIEKTRARLAQQRPLLRYYWTDQAAMEQSLAAGEIVASYGWNSSVLTLKAQGIPVEYMTPKEGILTWACGMMRLKDSPGSDEAAYDMLDAMLAPESGQWLIENYGYGHSNRKSFERVSPEHLADLGLSSPETLFHDGVMFQPIPPERREKYIDMFEEVKLGS